ncbi:hypothetical protein SAMN06265348_101191 [Pedobacter westerhofensis]|uniref:Uncharacterized protein n=2 Tax=Pedobacter westerhofensis TaxID=425512 RepID=A0A521AGT5_9SPHI|nr:hypothetical protein SAMN06265348_101191 [Pedobacter westerhofensis]
MPAYIICSFDAKSGKAILRDDTALERVSKDILSISIIMLKKLALTILPLICFIYSQAQNTRLIVRAQAKDAKFIGTGIGGAYVTVRNNLTGEILAKGLTAGTSGNTDLMMKGQVRRGLPVIDTATARFEASIAISEPTFVDIEAVAPFTRRNAAVKSTTQVWLIPGKDILGEGVLLEFPGFILDVLSPTTHEFIKLEELKGNLRFKVSLTMMCGCTITKGGVWDANGIEVKAIVKKEGVRINELPLHITAAANIFEGTLKTEAKGNYELVVYAYDAKTGNTGVDKINFVIQ